MNPLSYVVDALRHFMVDGATLGLALDFAVMIGVLAGLTAIAAVGAGAVVVAAAVIVMPLSFSSGALSIVS